MYSKVCYDKLIPLSCVESVRSIFFSAGWKLIIGTLVHVHLRLEVWCDELVGIDELGEEGGGLDESV
jgi:hypothetical protein